MQEGPGPRFPTETLNKLQTDWNNFVRALETSQQTIPTTWTPSHLQEGREHAPLAHLLPQGTVRKKRPSTRLPPSRQKEPSSTCLQHSVLSVGCLRDWFLSSLTQNSGKSTWFGCEAVDGSGRKCGTWKCGGNEGHRQWGVSSFANPLLFSTGFKQPMHKRIITILMATQYIKI